MGWPAVSNTASLDNQTHKYTAKTSKTPPPSISIPGMHDVIAVGACVTLSPIPSNQRVVTGTVGNAFATGAIVTPRRTAIPSSSCLMAACEIVIDLLSDSTAP